MSELDDILAAAWKYNDKPHILYLRIMTAAEERNENDPDYYNEIWRLMRAEYMRNRSEDRRMITAHPKLVAALRNARKELRTAEHPDGCIGDVLVDLDTALVGESEESI